MSNYKPVSGAFETVAKARTRLGRELESVLKRHRHENELGWVDCLAVIEDVKLRLWAACNDVVTRDDEEDGDELRQG